MTTEDDEYAAASRRAPDRVTLTKIDPSRIPGVPVRRPSRELPAYELEPTRPEVPAARRAHQRTLPGNGPSVVPPAPPRGPRRSVSPIPWDAMSGSPAARREAERHGDRVVPPSLPPISVETPIGHVSVPRRVIKTVGRHLWLWVGPLLLTALGTAYGYVSGYAKGLADAAERLAKIETKATALGVRVAVVETKSEATENAQAAEADRNRAERATALRKLDGFATDLEEVKKGLPRIHGIAK